MFQKDIQPRCGYCERGACLENDEVMCPRRGVVPAGESCRAFRYDPMKRVPPKPYRPDFSRLREEDFAI